MYPPFEFNNLLGPLMCLGMLAGAFKVTVAYIILKAYLDEQDAEIQGK